MSIYAKISDCIMFSPIITYLLQQISFYLYTVRNSQFYLYKYKVYMDYYSLVIVILRYLVAALFSKKRYIININNILHHSYLPIA